MVGDCLLLFFRFFDVVGVSFVIGYHHGGLFFFGWFVVVYFLLGGREVVSDIFFDSFFRVCPFLSFWEPFFAFFQEHPNN